MVVLLKQHMDAERFHAALQDGPSRRIQLLLHQVARPDAPR